MVVVYNSSEHLEIHSNRNKGEHLDRQIMAIVYPLGRRMVVSISAIYLGLRFKMAADHAWVRLYGDYNRRSFDMDKCSIDMNIKFLSCICSLNRRIQYKTGSALEQDSIYIIHYQTKRAGEAT